MRQVCPRCERQAPRFINGRFCISCYNRDREARLGRNAKGGRPRICTSIHPERLAVAGAVASRPVVVDRVMSRPEAIAILARQGTAGLVVGLPAWLPPAGAQMELALFRAAARPPQRVKPPKGMVRPPLWLPQSFGFAA